MLPVLHCGAPGHTDGPLDPAQQQTWHWQLAVIPRFAGFLCRCCKQLLGSRQQQDCATGDNCSSQKASQ